MPEVLLLVTMKPYKSDNNILRVFRERCRYTREKVTLRTKWPLALRVTLFASRKRQTDKTLAKGQLNWLKSSKAECRTEKMSWRLEEFCRPCLTTKKNTNKPQCLDPFRLTSICKYMALLSSLSLLKLPNVTAKLNLKEKNRLQTNLKMLLWFKSSF